MTLEYEPFENPMRNNMAGLILILLLVIDAILLAIFLSHRLLGEPTSSLFSIGRDHGFPEFFQYIKQIWFSLVLFTVYLQTRQPTLLIWSVLGGVLFLDDAAQFHERAGHIISSGLSLAGTDSIRGQDFGEVIAAGMLGAVFTVLLALFYKRDSRELREFSRNLFLLLMGLVFFGIVVDLFVHGAQSLVLFIIEDFGEMIVISVMLWYGLRYFETRETGLIQVFDSYCRKRT